MIYELRPYPIVSRPMAALHRRSTETTLTLLARHGIKVMGFWTNEPGGASSEQVQMLLAPARAVWTADFRGHHEGTGHGRARPPGHDTATRGGG